MVPAAFVPLAALPLTPNGKVDRRALPKPDFGPDLSEDSLATASPLEAGLAALWAEILGLPRLGPGDDFFACGGDSLLALRMVNRLRKSLGENISLVAVFEASTVAGFARLLSARHPAGVEKLVSPGPPPAIPPPVTPPAVPAALPGLVPLSREARRVKRSSLSEP